MATDVIKSFEKLYSRQVNFTDLQDAKTVRDILYAFKNQPNTIATSKIKYIAFFEQFLIFLFTDIESPEATTNPSNEEILTTDIKCKKILHEIETIRAQLSRDRGKDVIAAKARAKKKLITQQENNDLLDKTHKFLHSFVEENKANTDRVYSRSEALQVRDSLMAVATLRLGRRSKELMTMTLQEIADAEEEIIRDEKYWFIKVADQKASKVGEAATVAFHDIEYEALTIYITFLRPLIGTTSCTSAFISTNTGDGSSGNLSFAAVHRILQKYENIRGKNKLKIRKRFDRNQ